jgi:small-conductance mechanosensitive channel
MLSFLVALAIAIVGIAARPLIENFISGIVLSFSRQLRVGDTVLLNDEHYGTVEDINPTHTVVKLWDWRRYVIPNSSMLQKEIISYSHKDDYLWTHISFHVTPRAKIEDVERLAIAAGRECAFMADYEPPQFWVRELLPESTLCWLALWARKPEDAWYLRAEVRKILLQKLQAAGIETQLQTHRVKLRPSDTSDS